MKRKEKNGFTLIEILIYLVVLVIIMVTVSSFLLWMVRTTTKIQVVRDTVSNARHAMNVMTREIREADSLYTPTSTSTQLSLETRRNTPFGETTTYIDFFLCGSALCLKRESASPISLTTDNVEVADIEFVQVTTSSVPSVQIRLQIDYKNPGNKVDLDASITTTSTVSLRSY
ncbi:type II secretion system protein [Patescibacteria group bacterium]|nr:type II secretion system protein [Patescibacteria group bacterium]